MEQHQFKIIYSPEEEVYRILDLTDTSLVGITEMFENDDTQGRAIRAEYTNEIKANKGLRAKIVGYGVFVSFDDDNTRWVPVPERGYLLSVLRQMAAFFKENIIDQNPEEYVRYLIPGRNKGTVLYNKTRGNTRVLTAPNTSLEKDSRWSWKSLLEKEWLVPIFFLFCLGVILTDLFVFDGWLMGKIEYAVIYVLSGLAFIPALF